MKLRSDTDPSRWIRNLTSALRRAAGFLGLKLSAICRTMLLRYPGNGNSIPSLRTVATSVPFPPMGPPPAFGASVVFLVAAVFASAAPDFGAFVLFLLVTADALSAAFATLGVARAGVFCAGLAVGSGMSLSDDCAALGCVTP